MGTTNVSQSTPKIGTRQHCGGRDRGRLRPAHVRGGKGRRPPLGLSSMRKRKVAPESRGGTTSGTNPDRRRQTRWGDLRGNRAGYCWPKVVPGPRLFSNSPLSVTAMGYQTIARVAFNKPAPVGQPQGCETSPKVLRHPRGSLNAPLWPAAAATRCAETAATCRTKYAKGAALVCKAGLQSENRGA
jgi:hypothetical protein